MGSSLRDGKRGSLPASTARRTKSGCRTCRTRRVKCDEGRPACQRCVSTGRACDGYGIWGGGGNAYQHRKPRGPETLAPSDCARIKKDCLSFGGMTMNDTESFYFDWFKCRTRSKLPGLFPTAFWDNIVLQASSAEPAVLHAVLALGAVHRMDVLGRDSPQEVTLDGREKFALRQYSKAITDLEPHFRTKGHESTRVALVVCLLFTYLEFLRNNYSSGLIHLESGLKIFSQLDGRSNSGDEGTILLDHCSGSSEGWITEALSRLSLQTRLFGNSNHTILWRSPDVLSTTEVFQSAHHARQELELLSNRTLNLIHDARQMSGTNDLFENRSIQAGLSAWLNKWEKTLTTPKIPADSREAFAYQILRFHHEMTVIMTQAAIWPHDESVYDSYTSNFLWLIAHSISLVGAIRSDNSLHAPMDGETSISDLGWIPPLYYTALKCRHHRIRLQAIRLLEQTPHTEGPWDAKVAACIAAEVVRIEEGDFSSEFKLNDDFDILEVPSREDLTAPLIPASRRVQDLDVTILENPTGRISLQYKKGGISCLRVYNASSGRWTNGADQSFQHSLRQDQ